MYEHRSAPLLPRRHFQARMLQHVAAALGIVTVSLAVGTLGYWKLGGLGRLDAFMNASMILGGMGPVNELTTPGAKLFASFYALYSGIVFMVVAGLIAAPIFHRILHHFHLERGNHGS